METPKELERLQQIGALMAEHGRDAIIALFVIPLFLNLCLKTWFQLYTTWYVKEEGKRPPVISGIAGAYSLNDSLAHR